MTYNHRPILAAYFSTSNGFTEDASAVWGKSFPYLRSLPSPWDIRSPKYASTVEFTMDDIAAKLGISRGISSRDLLKGIQVLSRTEGRRIGSIRIGGKTFTGREVRDRLGLASADFAFVADGSKIRVQVRGDGHGVGMSQWGAQELALQGYTASQILAYYYAGTSKELLPGSLGKLETPTLPSE